MPTGGHIIIPQVGSGSPTPSRPGLHFEQGLGWGAFPVSYNSPSDCPSTFLGCCACAWFDPHNESMDSLWLGGSNFSLSDTTFLAFYWDGVAWNQHNINALSTRGGGVTLSRVPGGTEVYASCNGNNEGKCALVKYDGVSSWNIIRHWGSYSDASGSEERFIPIAIDSSTCVWIATEPFNGLSGYWLDVDTQYSGSDLPVTGFRGAAQLSDGSIFILTKDGYVYRSLTINGPFTLDNPTLGPFAGNFGSSINSASYMSASADGRYVVIQGYNTSKYWVRDGADYWTEYSPGSQSGTVYGGTPSAINRQILVMGSSGSSCRISYDGGDNWQNVRGGELSRGGVTGAFISDISTERRLVACLRGSSTSGANIWIRGDALHSPWAYWSDYLTSPSTAPGGISRIYRIVGFATKDLVISGDNGSANILHFEYESDSWSSFFIVSESVTYSHGTEYAAGKLHAVTETRYNSSLIYSRWNGTDYDHSSIAGSTASYILGGSIRGVHIQSDETGEEIWISDPANSQLWRSVDSGESWTNVYSAATGVHSDADQVVDVVLVSDSEVYVALSSTGTGTRFSKWDGSSWSHAAPDIDLESGIRCIFVDKSGDLWFLESSATGPTETYKLVEGLWSLEDTFDWSNGSRNVTGMAAMQYNDVISTSLAVDNTPSADGAGSIVTLADNDLLGWADLRSFGTSQPAVMDISPYGPEIVLEDEVLPGFESSLESPVYLNAFDFPLQFTNLGDLVLTSNERATEHDLRHSVMLILGGIPLAGHIGSRIPLMPFDPNDVVNSDIMREEIARSIAVNLPSVKVDRDILFAESEHDVKVIVPYISPKSINWSVIKLAVPIQDIDNG